MSFHFRIKENVIKSTSKYAVFHRDYTMNNTGKQCFSIFFPQQSRAKISESPFSPEKHVSFFKLMHDLTVYFKVDRSSVL